MTDLAQAVITRLARARDLLADLNERSAAIRVRASSRDRAVAVEVDGTGAMTALTLRSTATRLPADELATLIVNIAQTAAKSAVAQQRLLLEQFGPELLGLQDDLTQHSDR